MWMGPTYIYNCWDPLLPAYHSIHYWFVNAIHNQPTTKKVKTGNCNALCPHLVLIDTSLNLVQKAKKIEQSEHNREKELDEQKREDMNEYEQSWSPILAGIASG